MKNQAAVAMGSIRSEKKARSSRENGKLGGRPRIRPQPPPGFKAHPQWDKLAANCQGDIMRLHNQRPIKWEICKQTDGSGGYLRVGIPGGKQMACSHRIVYECAHGEVYQWSIKSGEGLTIDHINGVKKDNRIENLQILTHHQNGRKSNGKHGLPRFVYKNGNKYSLQICGPNRSSLYGGTYDTVLIALQHREEFLAKHGKCLPTEDATCA